MGPEEFQALVVDYSTARARLAEVNATAKDLRRTVKESEAAILAYMQDNNQAECDFDGGRLVRKQAKKTEGLKKEHIEGELRKVLPEGVEQALTNMYNRRLTDVTETLAVVKAQPT